MFIFVSRDIRGYRCRVTTRSCATCTGVPPRGTTAHPETTVADINDPRPTCWTSGRADSAEFSRFSLRGVSLTVPLLESKLFISRSCPILVLTTVLGCSRRVDVKNDVKTIMSQILAEKMRFENT